MPNLSTEAFAIITTILGLLLSGNIYFIKKLVDRVEQASGVTRDIAALALQMTEIKQEIKDLRRIEIQVAVLRSQLNRAQPLQEAELT